MMLTRPGRTNQRVRPLAAFTGSRRNQKPFPAPPYAPTRPNDLLFRFPEQLPLSMVNDLLPTRATARPGPQYLSYPPVRSVAWRCVSNVEQFGGIRAAAAAARVLGVRATRVAETMRVTDTISRATLAATLVKRIGRRVCVAFAPGSTHLRDGRA